MIAEDVPGQLVDLPVVLMDVEPGRVNTTSRAAAQCRYQQPEGRYVKTGWRSHRMNGLEKVILLLCFK